MKLLYIPQSKNQKTGNIIQQFIGGTREESLKSCDGCKLLKDRSCYAQFGTEEWAHINIIKAQFRKDYTLRNALKKRHKESKYVRFGSIGDPSIIPATIYRSITKTVREKGLGVLSYTHFWRNRGSHLKRLSMASCDSWKDIRTALKEGWRTTLVVSKDFIEKNGNKGKFGKWKWVLCPFQSHGTQCNKCGLCDASKEYLVPIVLFKKH